MGPDSFQWCPATGQGATGTNWSRGSSIWTWGRTSSLWGWRSTGTGCPGRLWSLLLWRYLRPAWTRSCAACSGWPCFGRRLDWVTHRGPFQHPTFCDSVTTLLAFTRLSFYVLYSRFTFSPCFQVLHLYFSRRQGVLVLLIHWTGVPDEHQVIASPEMFLSALCLFCFWAKEESQSSEEKLCTWFVATVLILPQVMLFDQFNTFGSCGTMEYSQAASGTPLCRLRECSQPEFTFSSGFFFPLPFPMYLSFGRLAFSDSTAVAPVQFISSQRAWSRYPYQQRMLSLWRFPQVISNYLW